jgi:hypothetical protein
VLHDQRLLILDTGNHAVRWLADRDVVLPFAGISGDAKLVAERSSSTSGIRRPSR